MAKVNINDMANYIKSVNNYCKECISSIRELKSELDNLSNDTILDALPYNKMKKYFKTNYMAVYDASINLYNDYIDINSKVLSKFQNFVAPDTFLDSDQISSLNGAISRCQDEIYRLRRPSFSKFFKSSNNSAAIANLERQIAEYRKKVDKLIQLVNLDRSTVGDYATINAKVKSLTTMVDAITEWKGDRANATDLIKDNGSRPNIWDMMSDSDLAFARDNLFGEVGLGFYSKYDDSSITKYTSDEAYNGRVSSLEFAMSFAAAKDPITGEWNITTLNDLAKTEEFSKLFDNAGSAWCARFVSTVLNSTPELERIFKGYANSSTESMLKDFKKGDINGSEVKFVSSPARSKRSSGKKYADETFIPKPGDVVFFNWKKDRNTDHVGIVHSVVYDEAGNITHINYVDGNRNRSDAIGSRGKSIVRTSTIKFNDRSLVGFGTY